MDTPDVDYGRCSGCHELKHVIAGEVVDHSGYGRPPVDVEEEVAPVAS